ncbi:enoyl-CoA hydratase-related protein [Xanthobacter sediminis]
MSGAVRFEKRGDIGLVTIENPGRHNALTVAMWQGLRELMVALDTEAGCRCLVLAGGQNGPFAAGADISEFETERATLAQVTRYHEDYVGPALEAVLACSIPTVAMVRGACMGGGLEITAMCDIRIAGADARFGVPINRMGFPLAFGETELMFKLFGRGVLAELLLEGRIYDAEEAKAKGLVQRVVASAALEGEAMATAARVAAGSPFANRSNKAQMLRLLRAWDPVSPEERAAHYAFADTQDYRTGYESFLRKTTPVFTGT